MNIAHIIETALFLLIVFLIGAILGYLVRHIFFRPKPASAKASTATTPPSPVKPAAPAAPAAKTPAAAAPAPKPQAKSETSAAPDGKPKPLSGPRDGKKDDLKRIKGVGPKIEKTLNGLGIYHFDQVAQWSPKSVDWINGFISFKDRIQREKWIDQAAKLAKGQETEFSKRVDKGSVPSSKK
ncbi:NADH-ubiquinone oxidoreductase chain E [hydrothermal vent metagenome]|uniref:NADH-ubiquinone oxidoreductase chain E n=1 Tax=hydrothermal vent metagenome TaxID=652676 RepID=A0A3B0U5Y4_9ZZZZ